MSDGKLFKKYTVPAKMVNMVKGLYEGFKCRVVHEGKMTDSFEITTGVRQECILFDNVMNKIIKGRRKGIQWIMLEKLQNLDFADENCLLPQR
jgi:hypothetical protein